MEWVALTLLVILIFFYWGSIRTLTHPVKMYWACLFLSAMAILGRILLIALPEAGLRFSPPWNQALPSLYYLFAFLAVTAIALDLSNHVLRHAENRNCRAGSRRLIKVLFLFFVLLLLLNFRFGIIFKVDANEAAAPGPLQNIVIIYLLAQCLLVYLISLCCSSWDGRRQRGIIFAFLLALLGLIVGKALSPLSSLDGFGLAFANLILFLRVQSQRLELDPVTGLRNRSGFFFEMQNRISEKRDFCAAVVALENFNQVYERYGQGSADEFLYQMGNWMAKTLKGGESEVFRYVGASFALLMSGDWRESEEKLGAVEERFRKKWYLGEAPSELLSVTVCDFLYEGGNQTAEQIASDLDEMLFLARRSGKDRISLNLETAQLLHRRKKYTLWLKKALREKRFQVWYQPVYRRDSGKFVSAEALIRLQDEAGAFLSPAEFMKLAEETGLENDVFWQVLEQVCSFLQKHPELPLESISVNLSAAQMEIPHFAERVLVLLERYEITPERICFEITERIEGKQGGMAWDTAARMGEKKFRFYLDDFGTGYSNLNLLLRAPFSCVKLDKSLLEESAGSEKGAQLLQDLVQLLHGLGLEVIAEGAEEESQAEHLWEAGADRIQGYFYARPMPEEKLCPFLEPEAGSTIKKEEG